MPIVKNKDSQTLIWVIVAVLVVIVIGVIIYFIMRSKKENYIQEEDLVENYEEEKELHKYLVDSYVTKYIEEFEMINTHVDHCHPLNDHFHKVLHVANIICHEPNLEVIRHEAERIGLHPAVIQRVLKDQESARKFSAALHAHLSTHNESIGKLLKDVAPELVRESVALSPKIEKFRFEYFQEERGRELLRQKLLKNNKRIGHLKQTLHQHLRNGHNPNSLPRHPEIKRSARLAHVHPETLSKITNSVEEVEKFIQGETTLENYDPELYIENYSWSSFTDSISHTFSEAGHAIEDVGKKVGGAVVDTVKKVGDVASEVGKTIADGVVTAADTVAEATKKAALAVEKTATDVGKEIAQAAEKVGTVIVNTARTVAAGATAAFDAVKRAVTDGINALVDGVEVFIALLKDFGAILKELIVKAIHMLINFLQEYFPALLGQYIRCKNGIKNQLTPCPSSIYEINDKKLKEFCAKKLLQFVFYLIGQPEFVLLLKIPGIKDIIISGVVSVFNTFWPKYIDPLLTKLLNKVIHEADPSTKDFKVEVTEWYRYILEKFRETEGSEFMNDWKQHIRESIQNIESENYNIDVAFVDQAANGGRQLFGTQQQPSRHRVFHHHRMLGRNGHSRFHQNQDKEHYIIVEEKRNKIHELLSYVVSDMHKDKLDHIVDEIVKISC